jgi:site-specific DNA recombinase
MSPSHSLQKSGKRYRYYVCQKATQQGWAACPNPSLPAGAIEEFIAQQIRELGRDPQLRQETIQQVRHAERERLEQLDLELRQVERDLAQWDTQMRALLMHPLPEAGNLQAGQLAELHEKMRVSQQRRAELIQTKLNALPSLSEHQIREALQQFDLLWKTLTAKEQGRILQLLIERVEYFGHDEKIDLLFRPTGIPMFLEVTERK